MHPPFRHRAATTLIETMIAMSVLVVGLMGVFSAFVTSKNVNERAQNQALAYQEIQAQIETVQYLPFISVLQNFKGYSFAVFGLRHSIANRSCGTVTRLANPDVYSVAATNPNRFPNTASSLPMRFRVEWADSQGPGAVEVVYVLTFRGL